MSEVDDIEAVRAVIERRAADAATAPAPISSTGRVAVASIRPAASTWAAAGAGRGTGGRAIQSPVAGSPRMSRGISI